MKQPVSRRSYARSHRFLGVMLQEGAPLLDSLWNEASELQWDLLRDVIRDAGLEGTAGQVLAVEAVQEPPGTGSLVNLKLRGGPERFYSDGLPVLWPDDVLIDEQTCSCDGGLVEGLAEGVTHYIYLHATVEHLDGRDLPDLDEPFLRDERGSFRPRVAACVRVHDRPAELPDDTTVALTVQGDYLGEQNALYTVEIAGAHPGDRLDVLWDDRNASTVTRVVEPAAAHATDIQVVDSNGFAAGDIVRIEIEGKAATLYQLDAVAPDRLTLRRLSDGSERSLADLAISAWFEVDDGPDIRVTFVGDHALAPAQLVTGLHAEPPIPHADHLWKIGERLEAPEGFSTYRLAPQYGLVDELRPWRDASDLRRHARSHDRCLVVDERPCWSVGAQLRISAVRFDDEPAPCCGDRPQEAQADESGACPPNNKGQRFEEFRTIRAIQRCGAREPCGDELHVVMAIRLDAPLDSDHLQCHDHVEIEQIIRVRRYAGFVRGAPVHPVTRCDHDGLCNLAAGVTLPNGLELCFTRPAAGPLVAEVGRGWHFAARIGGWYEPLLFAPVDPVARGLTLLATLFLDDDGRHTLTDMRPVPAPASQHTVLAMIRVAAEWLSRLFPGHPTFSELARQIAELAALPRVQGKRGPGKPGLFDLIIELAKIDPLSPHESPIAASLHSYLITVCSALAEVPIVQEGDLLKIAKALEALFHVYLHIPPQPPDAQPSEAHLDIQPQPLPPGVEAPPAADPVAPMPGPIPPAGIPLLVDPGNGPGPHGAGRQAELDIDLLALPTRAMRRVEQIAARRTRERLLKMWPTLGDVLRAEPSSSKINEDLRRGVGVFVQSLATLVLGRPGKTTPERLSVQVRELWAREVHDDYPPPAPEHLAAGLRQAGKGEST